MLNSIKLSVLTISFGLLVGCAEQRDMPQGDMTQETQTENPVHTELVSVLHPTEGNEAEGVVQFFNTDDGVRVVAEITGLEPNSSHGFHIHQFGDCRAPDGTSAGGHFNPHDEPHAGPDADERHVGDMGNLESDENGTAEIDYVDSVISFDGDDSILGRGIIVHAGEDDLESQPTGDAGARLACGVIGVAQNE